MTTNDIVAIIDVASDKLAGFVQAATPLAQEIVRQYQMRAAFTAVAWFAGGILLAAMSRWLWKNRTRDNESEAALSMYAIVLDGIAFLIVWGAVDQIGRAIAPICGLIGK
jgi:hypothetical protein